MKINLDFKKKQSITGFNNETPNSVYKEFHEHSWNSSDDEFPLPKHLKILYADYTYEDYSGDTYVLGYNFDKQQWFEVHGIYYSCYGLADQWDEEYYDSEEQLITVIKKRFSNKSKWGRYAGSSEELKNWLGQPTKKDSDARSEWIPDTGEVVLFKRTDSIDYAYDSPEKMEVVAVDEHRRVWLKNEVRDLITDLDNISPLKKEKSLREKLVEIMSHSDEKKCVDVYQAADLLIAAGIKLEEK